MAVPHSRGPGAGRGDVRRAGTGERPGSPGGVAEVLRLPVPARRRRARAALARVLARLRAEAACKVTPPRSLPPPRSSLGMHHRTSHVRLPDDVA